MIKLNKLILLNIIISLCIFIIFCGNNNNQKPTNNNNDTSQKTSNVNNNNPNNKKNDVIKNDTIKKVEIAKATDESYISFPDVVKLKDDSLILIYRYGKSHAEKTGKIVKRKGSNDGLTWDKEDSVLFDDPVIDDRDPSIALISDNNLLVNFFKYQYEPERKIRTYVISSSNNGNTFDKAPGLLVSDDNVATSSKIIKLENNDLLLPVYGTLDGKLSNAGFYRSKDDGKTWGKFEYIAKGDDENLHLQEPDLLQTKSGRIFSFLRTAKPESAGSLSNSYYTYSDDSGKTWAKMIDMKTMGHAINSYNIADGKIVLAFRCLDKLEKENIGQVAFMYSDDEGKTWSDMKILYETDKDEKYAWDCGYPSITQLASGKIFVTYYTKHGRTIEASIFEIENLFKK